jgi:hypothetical protein
MYRFRVPEIFLGCFLTVAVFATGMLFKGNEQATRPEQGIKKQEAASQGHEAKNPDAELTGSTWLTKDAAGFFTAGLVLVGIGQALLFYFQLRYMRIGMRDATRAAKAAEDAAKASLRQAEALVTSERPYLILRITSPGVSADLDGTYKFADKVMKFKFMNFGKTPAMIHELREDYLYTEGFNEQPRPLDPMKDRGRLQPVGIVSAQDAPFVLKSKLWHHYDQRVLDQRATSKYRLFFQGFIRFSDAFGTYYVMGFLVAYNRGGNDWEMRGDERYNYLRDENPKDIPPHPRYITDGTKPRPEDNPD